MDVFQISPATFTLGILLKRVKMGHVTSNLHKKTRISVPLPPSELTQVAAHLRLVFTALALILHLVDVPERFDGLCVSSSRWISKVFGTILYY